MAGCAFLPSSLHAQTDESAALATIRDTYNLPGLSVLVLKKGRIIAQGAAGVRRIGSPSPLLVDDRLNFASCTKFMTSTIAARLIDRGQLQWTTRIREVFPDKVASYNAALQDITLDEFLGHRSGVQEQVTFDTRHWADFQSVSGSMTELRAWVCDQVLKDPPDVPRGTYLYANQGYAVAAAMMEKITGKSWEQLIDEEIFKPLRLGSATLGISYNDDANPSGPVGHDLATGATAAVPRPALTGSQFVHYQASDGPGGYLMCTLADYAKFLNEYVGGDSSTNTYIKNGTREHLLSPWIGSSGYARGVAIANTSWSTPGPALNHTGDIFGEDTVFWAAPGRDLAIVVFTNCRSEDDRTEAGLGTVASQMVDRYASAAPAGPYLESPFIQESAKTGSTFSFTAATLPAVSYQLQRSPDLINWTDSGSVLDALNWQSVFQVTTSAPQEFFRVRTAP
ncbi:MAG: serine hydrolase [Akkermansiaceae bacterium]|nr:serine hydrolase [Akkermansiaceae bacterium]